MKDDIIPAAPRWVCCDADSWEEALALGAPSDETVEYRIRGRSDGLTITLFGGARIIPK